LKTDGVCNVFKLCVVQQSDNSRSELCNNHGIIGRLAIAGAFNGQQLIDARLDPKIPPASHPHYQIGGTRDDSEKRNWY
jgi:hypothetical protein